MQHLEVVRVNTCIRCHDPFLYMS